MERYGRSIRRGQLSDGAAEAIRRDATGSIQFNNAGSITTTGVTGTVVGTVTASGRHFASTLSAQITEGAAGTATVTIKRNGNTLTSTTGLTQSTTLTTSNTFTESNITWTLTLSVTAGTWTVSPFTVSVEDARG